MNIVFVTDTSGRAGPLLDNLRQASTFLRAQPEPGLVLVMEEQLGILAKATLQDTAKTVGLVPSLGLRGMVCDTITPCDFEHEEFEIRTVKGIEVIEAIAEINGSAYGVPAEVVRSAFSGSTSLEKDALVFAGFENGVPVSVAVTLAHADVAYLALVATKPAAQGKGYGTATVQRALLEGQEKFGSRKFALHATADGFPVYENLGFSSVAHMHLFELAPN